VCDVFAGAAIDDCERPAEACVEFATDDVPGGVREQESAGSRRIEKRVPAGRSSANRLSTGRGGAAITTFPATTSPGVLRHL
jgi:hypothetical protein